MEQRVARSAHNRKVADSSPAGATRSHACEYEADPSRREQATMEVQHEPRVVLFRPDRRPLYRRAGF